VLNIVKKATKFLLPLMKLKIFFMGRGDKKTKRGKISRGTYGTRRPKIKKRVRPETKIEIEKKIKP
jgi:30S ribosomal protein S31